MSSQFYQQSIPQISVKDLASRLTDDSQRLQLIDVRESEEVAIASIKGFKHFPLSQFAVWADTILTELDPEGETLVLCHHGVRSAQMCQWLLNHNFTNVKNIIGGIDAYALIIDPTISQY